MMRKTLYSMIPVLALAFFPNHLRAQDSQDRFKTQLQPIIEQVMEQRGIPGFAIAVVQNQKVVYAAGFGVRNLQNKNDKITPQSLFHMASITKPFVATSVMQLAEKAKVDLEAPVVKYLPYFRLNNERSATITVRQMLSHLSGMPDVSDYEWDKPQYDDGALERYVRSLSNQSLIAAPGAGFRYSNMAYEVLGDLIAKVSGMSFEDYVRRHILEPLGMKSSTLLVKQANPSLLTSPHVMDDSYQTVVSKVFPYNRMHSPSSTLYSNVIDMSRWAMANMNRGELDGKRILKDSTYDIMWKPAGEKWQQIGISWFLGKYREHRTISHSGGDTGFVSNLVMIPDQSIAVVMMSNFDRAGLRPITNAALDVALSLKPEPIVFKPAIAKTLYQIITAEGIDSAAGKYRDLKKNQPDAYDFQERELNGLGYNLLGQKKIKEAIKVFQLNVEAYPESSNVYDSLGEAFMLNGDKAPAIENYEISQKLNPNNANAVEKLKLLKADVSLAVGADLKGRFEAYRRAMNSHDLQAVLSCLASDYEFKVANSNYKVAKKDIIGQLEWDFAMNASSAYSDIQIKGNTISTVLTEQNDFYKAIGVSERKYQFTFVYNDQGLIKEAILEKSLSRSEEFDAALKPALEWARKERPGELAEIYPNDNFVYNTQMAKRWLRLLSDWHKATR
jgi:CubicO group peptidase (beta-lactamase class C family)